MTNIYYWLWLAVVYIQTIVTCLAIGTCFKPKIKMMWFCNLGALVCIIPLMLSILFLGEHSLPKSIIMIGIPILYTYYMSEGSTVKKTIFYIISLTVDSIIEVLINLALELCGMRYVFHIGSFTVERVILTLLSLLLMIPFKFSVSRLWCRAVNKTSARIGSIYLVLPFCQIFVYFIIIYENLYGKLDQEYTLLLILTVFMVLSVANIVYLRYISDVEEKKSLVLAIRDMEYAHKLETEHYTRIEEKRYELAKLRHDFRNEISTVKKLISNGKNDSARELLDQIERTLESTTESRYCSVPVIDAVVSEKEALLNEHGIRFEHNIAVTGAEAVQPIHLCSIFSNLLDNAIKANLKLSEGDDKYIKLSSAVKGGVITVKCTNPAISGAQVPEPSKSTGYGLKILNDIAQKYNGRFNVSLNDNICTATVILNLSQY